MSPQARQLVNEIVANARKELSEKVGPRVRLQVKFVSKIEESDISAVSQLYSDICAIWQINLCDLCTPSRLAKFCTMRQVLWFVAHKNYPYVALSTKARLLGRKEHTNVVHALRQAYNNLSVQDELFMSFYNPVKHLIHAE